MNYALAVLYVQLSLLCVVAGTAGRHAATQSSIEADAADPLSFYETHESPMGWRTALAAANGDVVSPPSTVESNAVGQTWQSQFNASTYNRKDRAAEKAYLNPRVRVTVKRPLGSWNTSRGMAARAYKNMRLRYRNTIYNDVRLGPVRFYVPGTVKELVQTIKRLNKAGTRWVVRGGGHNYETTALPSDTKSAVIDMARFTHFRIASDAQSAVIGAGQRLGEVYLRLAQYDPSLLIVAGTCASNGASGYLLGGGLGVSSRKYGWGTEQVRIGNDRRRKEGGYRKALIKLLLPGS
jgi:hypothetical protein